MLKIIYSTADINPFVFIIISSLWSIGTYAARAIPRPSDEEFIEYAKSGKRRQVAEACHHYSDLIDVQDRVGRLTCDIECYPQP